MPLRRHMIYACAVLISALATGCASGTAKKPVVEAKAIEAALYGSEAFAAGDISRAVDKFTDALRLDRAIDNRSAELRDLINLSRALIAGQMPDKAEPYLKDAVSLARSLKDDAGLSEAYATLSSAQLSKGEFEPALKAIDEAVAIDSRSGSTYPAKLNIKGFVLSALNRKAEAEAVYANALERAKKEGHTAEIANALRALASLNAVKSNYAEAFELYSKAYEADKTIGSPARIAADLSGMAGARLSLGNRDEALFLFERAYTVNVSAGRLSSALENVDRLIQIYKSAGDEANAGRYVEIREKLGNKAGVR